MVMPGETIATGASVKCDDCESFSKIVVMGGPLDFANGYYVGSVCDCGPRSRETLYFEDKTEADNILKNFKNDYEFAMVTCDIDDLESEEELVQSLARAHFKR